MAVSTTSHSTTNMRAPVRWSESSLRNTAPTPRQGVPSRRMPCSMILEIAGVDRLEARLLDREPQQPPARGNNGGSRIGAHVAISEQPHPIRAGRLHRAHARHLRELLGKPLPLRLHLDRVA